MPLSAKEDLAAWRSAALGALSFAGLVLISDTQSIIYSADAGHVYFAPALTGWTVLLNFFAALLTITTAGIAVWRFWPRRFAAEGLALLLYVLAILVPLLLKGPLGLFYAFWVWYRVVAFLTVALIYAIRRRWLLPLVSYGLLFCLGFLPVGLIPAIHMQFAGNLAEAMSARPSPAPPVDAGAKRPERIVWIIFDEFDYRLAFESRHPGLHLPALDALRRESVFLSDARPAGLWTIDTIPAYLTGKPFRRVLPAGPGSLELFPSPSGPPYLLDARQTLFGRLASQGARISISGYYHPYPRLLRELNVDAEWFYNVDSSPAVLTQEVYNRSGFVTGLRVQLLSHPAWLHGLPYSVGERITRATDQLKHEAAAASQAGGLASLMPSAIKAASDPSYDLVFVHLPIPHPPGVAGKLGQWVNQPLTGVAYLDNLIVADGFVAALRQSLSDSGLWDRTNLIVTSDHALRPSVWTGRDQWIGDPAMLGRSERGRIPFFFKPAGGGPGAGIASPVPLLCLHDFVLAVAAGEIRGVAQAQSWIIANSKKYPLQWSVTAISGLHVD